MFFGFDLIPLTTFWQSSEQSFSKPPPLKVVARSKTVAEPSPWDRSSTIVARKASGPQEVGVGRVAAREGRVLWKVVAVSSTKTGAKQA